MPAIEDMSFINPADIFSTKEANLLIANVQPNYSYLCFIYFLLKGTKIL